MVRVVGAQIRASDPALSDREIAVEAKARAVAMLSVQLGYGLYREMLLDTVGAGDGERAAIERALGRVYDDLTTHRPC